MGKIKGFLFAVRHREILMTDLGLNVKNKSGCRKRNVSGSRFSCIPPLITYALKRPQRSPQWHIRQPILLTIVGHREAHAVQT